MNTLNSIIFSVTDLGGSDIHFCTNIKPVFRLNGEIQPLNGIVDSDIINNPLILFASSLSIELKDRFTKTGDVDFSYVAVNDDGSRKISCRVNLFHDQNGNSVSIRLINNNIPSMEELRIPQSVQKLTNLEHGLIVVCGPTGCGKSTTIASMINAINDKRSAHIITIEDPVEYRFTMNKCVISQREVGTDCESFLSGLKSALRQDPDIILLGEMRDSETVATAISAAETGHLVFSTLHAANATEAVDRITQYFSANMLKQVLNELSSCFNAFITQKLLPCTLGGRVAAFEVVLHTSATENLVRNNKCFQFKDYMNPAHGMITMEQSIQGLRNLKLIDYIEGSVFNGKRKT